MTNPLAEIFRKHELTKEFTVLMETETTKFSKSLAIIVPPRLIKNKTNVLESLNLVISKSKPYDCEIDNFFKVLDTLNVSHVLSGDYLVNFTYSKDEIIYNGTSANKGYFIYEIPYQIKYIKKEDLNA